AGFMGVTSGTVGFHFGFGAEDALARGACGAALPVLGGADAETLFAGATHVGRDRGFELFGNEEWLIGAVRADAAAPLETASEIIGRDLLELVRTHGRHVARIWN